MVQATASTSTTWASPGPGGHPLSPSSAQSDPFGSTLWTGSSFQPGRYPGDVSPAPSQSSHPNMTFGVVNQGSSTDLVQIDSNDVPFVTPVLTGEQFVAWPHLTANGGLRSDRPAGKRLHLDLHRRVHVHPLRYRPRRRPRRRPDHLQSSGPASVAGSPESLAILYHANGQAWFNRRRRRIGRHAHRCAGVRWRLHRRRRFQWRRHRGPGRPDQYCRRFPHQRRQGRLHPGTPSPSAASFPSPSPITARPHWSPSASWAPPASSLAWATFKPNPKTPPRTLPPPSSLRLLACPTGP